MIKQLSEKHPGLQIKVECNACREHFFFDESVTATFAEDGAGIFLCEDCAEPEGEP